MNARAGEGIQRRGSSISTMGRSPHTGYGPARRADACRRRGLPAGRRPRTRAPHLLGRGSKHPGRRTDFHRARARRGRRCPRTLSQVGQIFAATNPRQTALISCPSLATTLPGGGRRRPSPAAGWFAGAVAPRKRHHHSLAAGTVDDRLHRTTDGRPEMQAQATDLNTRRRHAGSPPSRWRPPICQNASRRVAVVKISLSSGIRAFRSAAATPFPAAPARRRRRAGPAALHRHSCGSTRRSGWHPLVRSGGGMLQQAETDFRITGHAGHQLRPADPARPECGQYPAHVAGIVNGFRRFRLGAISTSLMPH